MESPVTRLSDDVYNWDGVAIDIAQHTFVGTSGSQECDWKYSGRFRVDGEKWMVAEMHAEQRNQEACSRKRAWEQYDRHMKAQPDKRTWEDLQREMIETD